MPDTGQRHQARKALREYDNPKGGKNLNFQNPTYLQALLKQYNMTEQELRTYANEKQYGRSWK